MQSALWRQWLTCSEASYFFRVREAPSSLAKDAERRQLVEVLRTLSIEQQTLLELHYWEDQDVAALAEIFEATPNAIRVRLHRARQALKERLEQAGDAATSALAARMTTEDE